MTSATLMRIAERTGYEVTLRPSIGDPPGHIEALFTRRGADPRRVPLPYIEPVEPLSNEPERGPTAARLIPTVRAELDRVLPDYMSPAQYIVLTDLPLLPNGKIDRAGLPVPTDRAMSRITPFVAPADPLEQVLVEVWSDVIGVDSLGTHDDFFRELGGHSLLAARLVARLRAELSVNVPLQLVFDAPRVVDMAAALRADVHDGRAVDPTASATGDVDSPSPQGEARLAMAGATGARRTEARRGR